MRTYLVRHGEAVGNTEHRFIGQSDVPLSAVGREQAEAVSVYLSRAGITHIVSSDLVRCLDTAAPLADRLGLEPRFDVRLREIANGLWSGLLPAEIRTGWPDLWQRYRHGEDVPRPEGERWADVRTRSLEALADLAGLGGDAVVAVFTHGGPLVLLAMEALGLEPGGSVFAGPLGPAANCGITSIRWLDQGAVLEAYNATGHLSPSSLLTDHPVAR
ncbi:MAG: histidine phosphatase family protein [Acidimicrobiia bacterium]|nr:histidine phosphatase family protein [Acidimicrobiia bacterium]